MATLRLPVARCAWAGRVILSTLFVVLLCCVSSASTASAAETVVTFTFDDGALTQVPRATKLETKGFRGTFYINSGTIGSPDPYFMSWSQLDTIAAAGHEIAGHTVHHKSLPSLPPAEQRSEICDDAAALRARGYAITNFAYPHGAGTTNPNVQQALRDCGFVSARRVGQLRGDTDCANCPAGESLPPANPYAIRTTPLPTGQITLSMMQSWVIAAEQNGGGWVPMVFHDICNACAEASVSAAHFNAFVDWVAKRAAQGTVVKTVRQALAEGPQFPPPTTAIACNGGACGTNSFKSPVSVSFTRTDGGGGLGATRYTLDGTDPLPSSPQYTAPLSLTQTTTVKFRTWDLTGTAEPTRTQVVNVDGTAPTVSVSSPANGSRVLTADGAVNVSIAAADTGSGVGDVQLLLDGDWLGSSSSTSSPYQFTLPGSLALGNHRLKAIATDRAGNQTTSAEVTFSLSNGTPTTSIACNGAACPATFVKGPLSVSLSAADGGGGVGATRYTLDGTDPGTGSTAYTGAFTLTESKTVKFRTWNSSGQPETVKSQVLKIDAVAPTATITAPVNGSSVKGDVTITVDAADAGSGLQDAELLLDGDWKAYTAAKPFRFTLPKSELSLGAHRIKVIVFDNLGNRADTAQVNFTLKDGLPETAIACNGGTCPADWVKGPLTISLSATDGGGGLGVTRYTLDGSDPTPASPQYTGPFTLTASATVKFRTWDLTGQAETVKSQLLKIDAVAPTATITSPVHGSNVQGDVTIEVNAADAGSGLADAELLLDGDWKAYTAAKPFKFTLPKSELALGAHRVKVLVFDKLGNRVDTSQVNFTLKDGLPETAIACNGAACSTAWQKGPVQVALSATHSGGGALGATRYTLDGSDPTASSPQYTGPFTLTESATVKYRTWDLAGQVEPVKTQQLQIDAVAPTAAIISPAHGSVQLGDVTIDVDAADAGSGLRDAELFVDGDWKAYSAAKPFKFTLPKSELALGAHRIKVIVFDNLGNRADTAQVNFTRKDGLPETAIACNGGACSADWQKGPVQVALSATHSGGGALGATRYTLDGSDPSESSTEYTGPFTLTESATIKYRTWDTTGAAETVRSTTLKIDGAAPAAQINSPAQGVNVVGDVLVSADVSDTGVGLAGVELFLDGDFAAVSSATSSPYEFTIAAGTIPLGTHRVKIIATDKLGNRTSTDNVTFALTNGLPTTTITCDGATCSPNWQKGPVQVSLAATESGNGVGATRYTLDGSDPSESSTEYTGPFTLTETTMVKFRSWDSNGNAEEVRSQEIKLDAVSPPVAITAPAEGTDKVGDVTVEVDASDAGVGIADVQLFLDGDYFAAKTAAPYSFALPSSLAFGAHRVKAIATDRLGNAATTATVNFTLKDGVPVTSIQCNGAACPGGFVKDPVSVTLSAADGGSGVGATRYTLDGSEPSESSTEYTGPFTVSETTTVRFRSWSTAGHAETVREQTIKIDAAAPTAQITSPSEGSNVVGDVDVSVDAADAGAGLANIELFLDGDFVAVTGATSAPYGFTIAAGTIPLGAHRVKVIATDKLGNSTSTANVNFNLTNGLPTTTIACDGGPCSANWQKGPVQVSLAAVESGKGVGATRYTLDGSDPTESSTEYTGPFNLTEATTVKFRSWDTLGHAEQVRTQEIKLDAIAPTVAITSPAEGTDKVGNVTVQIDAADARTGIADVQLFLDGDYFATSTTAPYSFALPASLSLGAHRVKAIATDKLGSSASSAMVNFTLKDGVPVTSIQCNGAACPAGFVKDPVSVTLAAPPAAAIGRATRYTLDGSDPTESSTEYTGPFTVSETTTVKFRSWNGAGDAEPVREQTLKIDTTAPTAQITSPAGGSNVVGDVKVSADASDAGIGLADVELFVDGDFVAISNAAPYEFTLAADIPLGTHRVKVIANDKLGHRTSSETVTFTLTNGLPTTTIACDAAACSANWQKGPVEVSLAAVESGNGLGSTRYTLDGSDPSESSTEYTGPFTLTETTTVKFRSYDSESNAEQVREQTIKLDAVAPTVAITSPAQGSEHVGTIDVQVDASDGGSGIADVQLFLDGDYFATDTAAPYSFTLPASLSFAAHRVKAIATDKLGTAAATANVNFTLKDGVPMTTIACGGGSCPAGFVKDPVSVTLAAIDGGSGVDATRYTIDGSDPDLSSAEYTGPFTVSETTTVKFRSWSTAGDVEPVRSQTIKIDTTAPTAELTSPVEGAEVEGDVAVTVNASDAGAGVGEVHIFIDGDYVTSLTGPSSPYLYTWHTGDFLPGAHRLKAVVADKLGHLTSTATVNVTIKSPPPPPGPPTTTIGCDAVGCPDDFVTGSVSVTLATFDGGAGVGPTRYTLDGADPNETSPQYAGPFTISETTTVKFRSWSLSGDIEEIRSQTIKIDTTAPTAELVSPTEGESITGDLVVMADAADAGAGVGTVDLYVDGDYLGTFDAIDGSYEITVPAGTLAPGTHTLAVEARDTVGNSFRTGDVLVSVAG